jgi:hypothetical protein
VNLPRPAVKQKRDLSSSKTERLPEVDEKPPEKDPYLQFFCLTLPGYPRGS